MSFCARRRTRLPIVVPLLASLLLLPYSAAAADATMGQDEVTLKDGGTVRGTVVSSQPGVSVKIIELGSTETRTIPWAEVGDVERGKFAPKGASVQPGSAGPGYGQPAPVYVQPLPVPVPAQNQVRLHVNSPQPASVVSHRMAYGRIGWGGFAIDTATPVCMSPCDQVFDGGTGQMYTVEGDFNSPPAFSLGGRHGDVELTVDPGSHALRRAGLALTITGSVLIFAGGITALFSRLLPSTNTTTTYDAYGNATQATSDAGNGWVLPTGLVIAGVGAAMLIGGIVSIVESKTKTDLHPMGAGVSGTTAAAPRYWMGEF